MDGTAIIDAEVDGFFGDEFREAATYTPSGGSSVTLDCHVDFVHELVEIGDLLATDGVLATIRCASGAVPFLSYDDQVEVRGVTYRVAGHEPNGTGVTVLKLAVV